MLFHQTMAPTIPWLRQWVIPIYAETMEDIGAVKYAKLDISYY